MELEILLHAVDVVEDVVDDSRDDSLFVWIAEDALHRVGFTCVFVKMRVECEIFLLFEAFLNVIFSYKEMRR